jgi:hypothetical protein
VEVHINHSGDGRSPHHDGIASRYERNILGGPTADLDRDRRYLERVRDGFIAIEVETSQGSFVREIRPATLLPVSVACRPRDEFRIRDGLAGAGERYGRLMGAVNEVEG